MGGRDEYRLFVGGLGWNVSQRHLQNAFSPYGKILDSLVMVDRNTGRPRGFGFITFADRRAMEEALRDMHGRELDGRIISVNKAAPRLGDEDAHDTYGGGARRSDVRESFRGGDRLVGSLSDECFKCGHLGHWARDCPYGGGNVRYSSPTEYGRAGLQGDREYDRYGGGRYEREHFDGREGYGSRDRFSNERYQPVSDRLIGDRYSERYPQSGYGRERDYERDGGFRGVERYGVGGPTRYEKGSYRDHRAHPYDAPRRDIRR